jgi:phosphatidylinositol alpha 1,6-mannosyltransferase
VFGGAVYPPRVAFFTDSFHEVNGVALTSRQFVEFARTRALPFFSVHPGPETRHSVDSSVETLEIGHSGLTVELDAGLLFDVPFLRHRAFVRDRLRQFAPHILHVTGPGHTGILGAVLAYDLNVPLVASWHTNLHEYSGRRLKKLLSALPIEWQDTASLWAEDESLSMVLRFYGLARLLFAPNRELVDMLAARLHKPSYLMQRGIDCNLFHPGRRTRQDHRFVIGYVGRLSPEKNVRYFQTLERALLAAGVTNFQFIIVGEGSEREWLRVNLLQPDLPGVLRGDRLAECYANMDVFVFPSETDTFGNVVLEAQASGVPAVVTGSGGPKFLVKSGVDGFVAQDAAAFAGAVIQLYRDPELLRLFRENARHSAMRRSWDAVFESVYAHYLEIL